MIGDIYRDVKKQLAEQERVGEQIDSVESGDPWAIIPHVFATVPRTKETRITPEMWLGPSTVSGMCPKAFVLAAKMGVPLIKHEKLQNKWTMDRGTFLHELLQNFWFGRSGMILGGWKCDDCGHIHGIDIEDSTPVGDGHEGDEEYTDKVTLRSAIPMPVECEKCGMRRRWRHGFTYVEPMVYDLGLRVSGYVDGIIRVPDTGMLEIMDIKGTSKKALAALKRRGPYLEHVKQVSWYSSMMGLKKGRILYVARDEEDVSKAFLEKPVELDEKLIAQEKENLRAIREEAKKDEPRIPPCPHGGHRPWGPCECAGLEAAA